MTVTIDDLTVRFGATTAVDGLSLSIETHERFALMGPSGSGKSTLLRAIAGLERPSHGSVTIDGNDITRTPTHDRPVGLMFQEYALFPHLSVTDNVAYGLVMHGIGKGERRRRTEELLDLVGLTDLANRRPDELSGGERQRVALARTLAPRPRLVLLDEPLGSLDFTLRESLLTEMKTAVEASGAAALYVTHDRTEAFAFADRVGIIADGRLIRVGTPAEVWSDPRTSFVARFIGHPNVVAGSLVASGAPHVSIPLDGIVMDDGGELVGQVRDVAFSDGGYLCVVAADGAVLRAHSSEPRGQGDTVRLRLDRSRVLLLDVDEV